MFVCAQCLRMVCGVDVGVCVCTVFTYGVWGVRRCVCVCVCAQCLRMMCAMYVGVCVCTVFTYGVCGVRRCLCMHSVYVWCVRCT